MLAPDAEESRGQVPLPLPPAPARLMVCEPYNATMSELFVHLDFMSSTIYC